MENQAVGHPVSSGRGPNPVQVALDSYSQLEESHDALERELVGLRAANQALLRENTLLKGNYATLQGNFNQLQAYSVGISTQLAVIQETVGAAMEATQSAATKLFSSPETRRDPLEELTREFVNGAPLTPRKK